MSNANSTNNDILSLLDSYLADPSMTKVASGGRTFNSIGDELSGGEHDAKEGERARENRSDVKSMVPDSVSDGDEVVNGQEGGQKTKTNTNFGLGAKETGKEVPAAPVRPHPDPGTSSPAKSTAKEASVNDLVEQANDLLAEFAVMAKEAQAQVTNTPNTTNSAAKGNNQVKQANFPQASAPQSEKTAEANGLDDQQLGYLTGKYIAETLVKQAAAQAQPQVNPEVELTKLAEAEAARVYQRADVLSTYLAQYLPEYVKQADMTGDSTAGGPAAPSGMPPGAGDSSAQVAAAPDPAAAIGGAGGAGAAGADQLPPEIMQLAEALLQQGVTPEQLEALLASAAQGGGAGGPGAGPGAGAGAPPMTGGGEPDKVDEAAMASQGGADTEKKAQLMKTAAAIKSAVTSMRKRK